MGVGEVLVDTHDIAGGLGINWRPPDDLAAFVVRRLCAAAQAASLRWGSGQA